MDRVARALSRHRALLLAGVGLILLVTASAGAVLLLTGKDDTQPDLAATAPAGPPITQVRGLPPGATDCDPVYPGLIEPYNRGARGTPQTSCQFVEQVRKAYSNRPPASGPQQLRVASPATYKWYDLVCVRTESYVTCTGGVAAIIYLYNA